ncbi:DedA family protein [Sporosarcina sp. HYO08]|uniref:DedA family protein n=1 Tax=Sporosarcina sp. HYO08 TaxID=1759557 RepID=UPI0012E38BE5|nr:DedA family protein [Sporosarcina sp. HYO08]
MVEWIGEIMSAYGYLGVFLLILIENLFPPIPSEVILAFGGFMTTYSELTETGVIVAATAGSVIGAMILYSIGLLVDVPRLEKMVDRWGHVLRLKRKDIHRADEWFSKSSFWTVLLCRLVPLIRSLISIPAGMSTMNFFLFIILTAIGSLVWNSVLVYTGAALGENWESIVLKMDTYSNFVYILLGIVGIIGCLSYIGFRRRRA